MPNQPHPAPGSQGWILLNMASTHRDDNFKVSPRIRDHSKREPGPAETMTRGIRSGKCNTFIQQCRVKHKWSTTPAILPNRKKYSDLTRKFPVQSDRGNNYILVVYHYDANNIMTTTLKNRRGPCIISGITKIHDKLRNRGLTPKLHIMDNEVSGDLKIYVEDSDKQFQMVPPHMHRRMLHKGLWELLGNNLLLIYVLWTLASLSTASIQWMCGGTSWKCISESSKYF